MHGILAVAKEGMPCLWSFFRPSLFKVIRKNETNTVL